MIGIYYRVSTEEQSLGMQEHAVENWLKEQGFNGKNKVYSDIGLSGSSSNRPSFRKLLADCESGKIKNVVVYKLDRLTRDAVTAIRMVLRFDELGVRFVSVTQPMFSYGTPFRHAIIAIFAELAQMEREMIVERVRAGLAVAKKKGVKLGAPIKINTKLIDDTINLRRTGGLTYREIAARLKVSVGTIHRILNEHAND